MKRSRKEKVSRPDRPEYLQNVAMCIIFLASSPHLPHGLKALIAFNRDEAKSRATLPAHQWENSTIIGGKDASGRGVLNGTWLGLDSVSGRFGALLNVHSRSAGIVHDATKAPRGGLVPGFLNTIIPPSTYVEENIGSDSNFNCFNLVMGELTGDQPSFSVYDYHSGAVTSLTERVTVIGNLPPTPSFTNPRAVYGQTRFLELLNKFRGLHFEDDSERNKRLEEMVFRFLLTDTTDIPVGDTGLHGSFRHLFNKEYMVGEWECGTVSSTMIAVDVHNRCTLVEWTHIPEHQENRFECQF